MKKDLLKKERIMKKITLLSLIFFANHSLILSLNIDDAKTALTKFTTVARPIYDKIAAAVKNKDRVINAANSLNPKFSCLRDTKKFGTPECANTSVGCASAKECGGAVLASISDILEPAITALLGKVETGGLREGVIPLIFSIIPGQTEEKTFQDPKDPSKTIKVTVAKAGSYYEKVLKVAQTAYDALTYLNGLALVLNPGKVIADLPAVDVPPVQIPEQAEAITEL